jgi:2-dehydropantoate 2-reductase
MNERIPKMGIVGLGPVGSILTAHLVKGGVDVVVEDIAKDLLEEISRNGLNITGIRNISANIDKTVGSLAELMEFDLDVLFIATKGCFLRNVLAELKPVHSPKTKIVSFQNGMDNERLIADTLEIKTTYRVVINYAGNLKGLGNIKMNWFQPPNYIGALKSGNYMIDETTRLIANTMTTCGLKTEEDPDVKRHVWKKTILNSALCSICALTRQTMKEAMDFQPSHDTAIKILEEGLAVAKADGYDFGEDALEKFTDYLEKGGAHKPSMLVDVEYGRMIEVDFLSGAIVNYGKLYRIQTPINNTVTRLLKSMENSYLKMS